MNWLVNFFIKLLNPPVTSGPIDRLYSAVIWAEAYKVYHSPDRGWFADLHYTKVDWNSKTGFQIMEPSHFAGWLVFSSGAAVTYAMVVYGSQTGDVYMIFTDSLREFVADYGGAKTWHSRGAWKVARTEWNALISALKNEATSR